MPAPTYPFNVADTIYAGLSVIALKPANGALSGVTAATDTLTKTAHGLSVDDQVTFVSGTGFTGLVAGTTYFVTAAPTADTFKIAATRGGAAISVGTSSAGVMAKTIVFEAIKLEADGDEQKKQLKRPDAQGVLRTIRTVRTESSESFKFDVQDIKRLLRIFGGALKGYITGTATIWIPDPADASGKVALKSEADFACTLTRDGGVSFGDSDFSKSTIMIESNKVGDVAWTADATA
jgi:hypothetical protein